ncbi:hypothetical protein FQN60_013488 [Etheostoma spectabile]|uniref:UDENN domain-containing protein n=1 Tax=Etheostoma spectabile TaxID=54343 RepID=A0A5J5CJU4_9PERO|nr:hypothetical protein FQN60_013488 [Etheostoma spectabile]
MESHGRDDLKGPVLHIVVVGFHHKKGCQGHDSNLLPEEWRYLPFLALPDGAHNYQEDTVYFHLPPLNEDMKCVYGVSCYRQIEAKALKVRLADVTRETVQKSVCVLSRVPLYGLLQAKLQLITHAYFEEKDFSQISILKILILFKLILLEKKVLFYVSPVNRLVGALMTVLSLFPGMIEHGLVDSSHYRPKSSLTEDLSLAESVSGAEEFVSVSVSDIANTKLETEAGETAQPAAGSPSSGNSNERDNHLLKPPSRTSPESSESDWETLDPSVLEDSPKEAAEGKETEPLDAFDSKPGTPITVQPLSGSGQGGVVQGLVEEAGVHIQDPELRKILSLTTADLRFADYLVKHVTENRDDVFLDGTGWEGGDEWIRAQFTLYLHSLLSSTLQQDNERLLADYGAPFVAAWKITHNYRVWHSNKHPAMAAITPGHPFQGQYSVADVKLRLSHSSVDVGLTKPRVPLPSCGDKMTLAARWSRWSKVKSLIITAAGDFCCSSSGFIPGSADESSVQNSERGKKIGNAMMTTSRSVVQTGKAVGQSVGGALTSAKSAMSSWFSTLAQPAAVTPPAYPEPATEVHP